MPCYPEKMAGLRIRHPFSSVQIPRVIKALIAVTALISIVSAIAARHGETGPIDYGLMLPWAVWHGQVWRLASWVLYELAPLNLVFACLTLFWFGRDLVGAWGERRFLAVYFGLAIAAAAVTCLVGLAWPAVAQIPHGGSWPVQTGLIVAWGVLHPERQLLLYFVVRVTGRQLVWITFLGTVLFALFAGLAPFVPHFAAELLMLAWLGPVRRLLIRRRKARQEAARAWTFESWLDRERRR
jgi:membrane associated rhomboid family serine protease